MNKGLICVILLFLIAYIAVGIQPEKNRVSRAILWAGYMVGVAIVLAGH